MSETTEKRIIRFLYLSAVLVCIKSIFTDFAFDNSYMVAMSYRHLSGDRMFIDMWEPHQTSAFLADGFMFIYRLFVPSLTGVVLFLQIVGTLLWIPTAVVATRILGRYTDRLVSCLIFVFFTVYKVKQSPFLDYAGQLILFSVWVFIFLARYLESRRLRYPVLAGVFTFLEVIAYPSAVFAVIPALAFLLAIQDMNKRKSVLCYILGGAVPSLLYAGYFIIKIGLNRLLETAGYIFGADSHSSTPQYGPYWREMIIALSVLAVSIILALIIGTLVKRKTNISIYSEVLVFFGVIDFVIMVLYRKTGVDGRYNVYFLPVILIIAGLISFRKMTGEERTIWLLGMGIGLSSFVAAFLLSDLGIITLVSYLELSGAVSFISIKYLCRDYKRAGILFTLVLLMHRGLVVWGYGSQGNNVLYTYELENVIRSGPAAGLVCTHFNKEKSLVDIRELNEEISENDKLLVIGPEFTDSLVYLYTKAETANFSTISSPIFNEAVEDYYRVNPDKFPTVVIVDSWFGKLSFSEDSYIVRWIEGNFDRVKDLSYYRVYRLR